MLTAKLVLERLDKDGVLLEKREQPSRSFLLNFIALLYLSHSQTLAAAPLTLQDITNTARTVDGQGHNSTRYGKGTLAIGGPPGYQGEYCTAGYLSGTYTLDADQMTIEGENIGIVVGTGVGAVAPTDYALGTKIVHGEGAGEFLYGGTELYGLTFADPNGQFTIRRYFTNASGGGITVEEVGIYSVACDYDAKTSWSFGIARDLTGGVAVADTELLRVTYVVQITV